VQLADAEEQLQQAVRDKLQIQLELSQAQVGPRGGGRGRGRARVHVLGGVRACGIHVGVSLVRAVRIGVCVGIVWVGMAFAACLHEGGRPRKGRISGRKGAVWPLCGP
jgi:hypothetical protein